MRRSRKIPEWLNDGRNNPRKPTQNWFHHPSRDAELAFARLRRIDGSRVGQLLSPFPSRRVPFIAESLTWKPCVRPGLGGSGPHAIKRAMALLEWLIVAAALFGGLVSLMYVAQRSLMYFPERLHTQPAMAGFPEAQEVALDTKDGTMAFQVPEADYRAFGYEPHYDKLPWKENYDATKGHEDRFKY